MPRYRFRWENLNPTLIAALCAGRDLNGREPAAALRSWYGARPRSEFVADVWPVLRDEWLAADDDARRPVVSALREYGLGDTAINVRSRAGQLEYLRTCRNQSTLREIVLDELIASGEPATEPVKPAARPPSPAWGDFEQTLAGTLAALEEDQYLIVSVKGTGVERDGDFQSAAHYVQFAAQGSYGLRAETVSNAYLVGSEKLPKRAVEHLAELGWQVPTNGPAAGKGERDPDGSPNHYRDFTTPVPYPEVAHLAAQTLREVFTVDHPGFLQYSAFDKEGDRIVLPLLGLKREPAPAKVNQVDDSKRSPLVPQNVDELRAALEETLLRFTELSELVHDDDGDIPLTWGSTVVFVRVNDEAPVVRVLAPVLVDAQPSAALMEAVSDINRTYLFVSAFWDGSSVVLTLDINGNPYVEEHVVQGIKTLGEIADELDDDLQRRFGGRVLLGTASNRPVETGGYL